MAETSDVGIVPHTGPVLIQDAETYEQKNVDRRVVCLHAPASAAAEQYRLLALRLEAAAKAGLKRIAITSSVAGEGRTITAVNTAIALGRGQRNRTVLVDTCFRAPGTHKALGLAPQIGLADVLRGAVSIENTMWRFGDDDLHVVPAGYTDAPHVAIGSRKLGEVMSDLSQQSDLVLIDAPPVLPTADLQALARHVDGVVLVIRAGRTPREVVQMALDALAEVHIIGCVLVGIEQEAGMAYKLLAEHDKRQRALPARSTVER